MISEESHHRYDVIIYYPIRIGDIFLVRMRKGREIKRKLTHSCLKRDYNDSLVSVCTCLYMLHVHLKYFWHFAIYNFII